MADTVRIEIPIETIDNTDPELSNITRNFERMERAVEDANNSARRANTTVTQFDRQAQRTEKSLANWAKEKYQIMLEAKDKIAPVLSTLGNGLRSFVGKTWNVTMRAIDLVTSPVRGIINLLKNPIFQVGAVLGVSIGLKDTIETYKDFEAAMSQVQAVSGATSSELTKLTNKAKEMGAATKFTAEESAQAFNYMAMAGWKTEDMLNGIEGILSLAAASGEDLATTSDIVTDALTAFGLTAADAGHFSDVLAAAASNANTTVSGMGETFKYAGAMAGTMGYSIEDVALMVGIMANSGIKASMAGTELNSIFTRLSTNTNGAADAIEELGIDFFDSTGKARDLSDVIDELRKATENYTDEQKSNIANTIAGTRAQAGLLAILNASEEDYNKLADAINNADGAAATMSETMLDNLQGSITLLQSAVDGVKISFGERLSPYVRGLADWLTEQMPEVELALDELMDWAGNKVDRMQRRFTEITDTKDWQDADFFGKVRIVWDEFIAEPFSDWWNSTGKAKFAGFAQDIGEGIGTGLKVGIMTLLGIDLGETIDEGASIGASFAKGFSEGFDFETVSENLWQGFNNLLSNAGKLLPGGESADLTSVFSAIMLRKIATPFLSMGWGAFNIGKILFGTDAATGTSLMGSIIGTTGNATMQGTGLLNVLANAGYSLTGGAASAGGYFGAGTAMSGTSAALVGGAGIASGVAAGATLVSSAIDAYKAIKSEDADESKAYGESAAWKAGGVAAGAAAGAAIGSIIPGIGTAVGALVGAGVGGIAGWIKGNKVKEEYQENVEEMQREAERVKRIYEITGLSVDKVRFVNEDLNEALQDTNLSAEELANFIREDMAKVADEAFGDIHLSLTEIKKLAEEITFGNTIDDVTEFAKATETASSSLSALKSTINALKKENWKASLGMKLDETEQDSYKKAIDDFVKSASQYIEDNHYQATVALKLLTGKDGGTDGLNSMYADMETQIDDLAVQLSGKVEISLSDGVIQLNEREEITNLQQQIEDITSKIANAREEARLDVLKIKYASGSELDVESFKSMQEELESQVESWEENYNSALEATLTTLKLQYPNEGEEFDAAYKEAMDGYTAQLNDMNVRVQSFNLETIAEAWDEQLNGILPDLDGSLSEKLGTAMNNALLLKPDASAWTQEEVMEWFDLDGIDTSAFENIYEELKATAEQVPAGVKEEILQSFKDSIPTAEEIMNAVDFTQMTWDEYTALTGGDGTYITSPGSNFNSAVDTLLTGEEENFNERCKAFAENIQSFMEANMNPQQISEFMNQYMTEATSSFDFESVMAQYGPISNEYYEQLVAEWQEAGTAYGEALNGGASASLLAGSPLFRTNLQSALDAATASPFTISPTVNVTPNYNLTAGVSSVLNPNLTLNAGKNAAGGYVSGGPQLSWLAEEGYGEFVIPTNPSRRARALDLYEQAGVALGVSARAEGGYVRGSFLSDTATDYNLFNDANRNAPLAYNETTEDNYSNETATTYEPVLTGRESSVGGTPVQVQVSVAPEFVIHGGNGQSEEDIMQVIRRHMKEMADELGGEIAGKLEEVFSNMPLKEA